MRALVTGATGFIGNKLVIELQKKGWDVKCLVRGGLPSLAGIRCFNADLSKPDSLDVAIDQMGDIDVVFHLGALLPDNHYHIGLEDFLMVNTISTCRLLKIATVLGVKAFVFASSLPVIGKPQEIPITENHPTRPEHPYFLSKLTAELSCEMYRCQDRMNVTSLRITSPYGPGMQRHTVLANFVEKAICSKNIEILGSGCRVQNFVHISDVIHALVLAANTNIPGVYNLAGTSASMVNLAKLIVGIATANNKITFTNKQDPQEDYRWAVDTSKAEEHLGYYPQTNLESGLIDYIRWRKSGKAEALWYEGL